LATDREKLASVEARLGRAVAVEHTFDASTLAAIERRAAEGALRLGGLRERERAARMTLAGLEERARRVQADLQAWETGRAARLDAAARVRVVARAAASVELRMDAWLAEARSERERREAERARFEEELGAARRGRRRA